MKQDSQTRVLARPQLRVMRTARPACISAIRADSHHPVSERGRLGNLQPITSYTYQDVGVKTTSPKVHHNKEVTLKLKGDRVAL